MKRYYFSLILPLMFIVSCNSGASNSWTPAITGKVTYNSSIVNLNVGESTIISASYSGGNVTVQPFLVTFTLSNTNIATVSPNYCYLDSNVSCNLTITGISLGNTVLTALSNVYLVGIESVMITVK